jgi:hypothetical protein
LIAQSKNDIPFDIQHIRTILYSFTPRGMRDFEDALEATIKSELETPRTLADVLSRKRRVWTWSPRKGFIPVNFAELPKEVQERFPDR